MTYCPNKCSRIQCILDLILPANTIYFLKDLKVSRMYPTHVISNVILYSTNFVTTILRTIYVFHHAIHHIIYRITYLIFCHIAISPPLLNAYTFAASFAGRNNTPSFPHSRLHCRTEGRGTLSFLQVSTSWAQLSECSGHSPMQANRCMPKASGQCKNEKRTPFLSSDPSRHFLGQKTFHTSRDRLLAWNQLSPLATILPPPE